MQAIARTSILKAVEALLSEFSFKKATVFQSDKLTVKATRIGKRRKRDTSIHIRLTIGSPNYAERKFVKAAKKRGNKFPLLQLKYK